MVFTIFIEYLPGEKYPAKNADTSDSLDCFKDAGCLLTENDLVIDIDELPRETIEKMISVFNIKTEMRITERGVHLVYKKPTGFRGSKKVCALGFPLEYKHSKNTRSVTVKRNGIAREVLNEGIREDLPDIFALNKRFEVLLGLEEGDGRNQKLFEHRGKLAGVKGWRQILSFVNSYIFAEPLGTKEFETIARDMVVEADEGKEPQVAKWLMDEFKMLKFNNEIYFYTNGEYVTDEDRLYKLIFAKVGDKKTYYVEEVKKQIQLRARTIVEPNHGFDIKFNNGILRRGEFIEIDYVDFTPYNINVSYYPDAEPVKDVDGYIDHLTGGDEDYRDLLMEILGHTLIVDKEFKRLVGKFFIFVGGGGNGKGTLLQIIKTILNPGNCTALSIPNMSDERYFANMRGKLANLGDDIQDEPINNDQMKMLKNISTCDFVESRKLYEQSQSVQLTVSLIFTSNHILKSWEKGHAYKRRVMWLPMYSEVSKDKIDPLFITKQTSEKALEYWTRLMVEGYQRLYKNCAFTESELVNEFNALYHLENNPVMMWIEDMRPEDFIGERVPAIMEEYSVWAEENGYSEVSTKMLKSTIYDKFRLGVGNKKIQGKQAKVFMHEDDTKQKLDTG